MLDLEKNPELKEGLASGRSLRNKILSLWEEALVGSGPHAGIGYGIAAVELIEAMELYLSRVLPAAAREAGVELDLEKLRSAVAKRQAVLEVAAFDGPLNQEN